MTRNYRPFSIGQTVRPVLPVLLFLFVVLPPAGLSLAAQEQYVQPSVHLVFQNVPEATAPEASGVEAERVEVGRAVTAAVEARFESQRRYRLSRSFSDDDPQRLVARSGLSGYDAVVFFQFNPVSEGFRVAYDVFRDGSFRQSGNILFERGEPLFLQVDRFASDAARATASVFPGFGRLRFSNSGYNHNYYVYADGTFLGADIGEIDLPVGTYEIEIRRRDDGFSHPVGQRTVTLKPEDYVEVLFSMDQAAPPVPGYMRLTNPSERWRGIFTFRGAGLIPMSGFEGITTKEAWTTAATVLFGHVPFRHFVTGVEVEQLRFRGTDEPGVDLDVQGTSVMGVLGLTAGPVSGVDFIVHGGAGVSIYSADGTYETENRYDPAFNGAVEFGFGIGKYSRLSLQTGLFGIVRDGRYYSWLQLGAGLGGRF